MAGRLTLKAVNAAIAAEGIALELVAGEGYFYFVGEGSEHARDASIMVFRLNHQALEGWIADAKRVAADIADNRPPSTTAPAGAPAMLKIVPSQQTADALAFSGLIWFSSGGSGDAIKPVTAAFLSYEEAASWACRHPGQTVHFPGGNQLQASFAMADGLSAFIQRATHAKAQQSLETSRRLTGADA